MDTFARASLSGGDFRAARDALDEFVLGFNQACERFAMVDVGSGKEAAEAKMKGVMRTIIESLLCQLTEPLYSSLGLACPFFGDIQSNIWR